MKKCNLELKLINTISNCFIYEPVQMEAQITSCDYFTPEIYWFIDGYLASKEEKFRFIFYKKKKYLVSVIASCGTDCIVKEEFNIECEEKDLELPEMSSFYEVLKSNNVSSNKILLKAPQDTKETTFSLIINNKPVKVGIPQSKEVEVDTFQGNPVWVKENS